MYTLFIDTHDKQTLVILYKEKEIVIKKENLTNIQSEVILPTIQDLFKEINLDIKQLNKIIVVNGPGSFTGVRLGITVAKTISYSLNIPVYSITSLALMAHLSNISVPTTFGITDSKGAYLGTFDSNKQLQGEYKYFEKKDLANEVTYNLDMKYENLLINNTNLILEDCFLIKPLYIKRIEALK